MRFLSRIATVWSHLSSWSHAAPQSSQLMESCGPSTFFFHFYIFFHFFFLHSISFSK